MIQMNRRIEICGGIASGKTTLANLLTRLDLQPTLENFKTNPFWRAFYADPVGTAFETEISFLLQHYHEIKIARKSGKKFVCDFSMYLDLAYAHVTLSQDKLRVFQSVYREIEKELEPPSFLIHLKCNPEIELQRIRHRGRDAENSITIEYLQKIDEQLKKILKARACLNDFLVIDSGQQDFAHNESVRHLILEQINSKLL